MAARAEGGDDLQHTGNDNRIKDAMFRQQRQCVATQRVGVADFARNRGMPASEEDVLASRENGAAGEPIILALERVGG